MSSKKIGSQPSKADDALAELLPNEEDLIYEEELLRNPYNLKMWLRYIGARKDASPKKRYVLYERALQALPGSFKVHSINVRS
jgi:pre-mRNA-splicing factor SYF1